TPVRITTCPLQKVAEGKTSYDWSWDISTMLHFLKFVVVGLTSSAILAAESAPCLSGTASLTVETAADLKDLTAAMNCSGITNFNV
ncbi:unnamed protein product, partial [Laminaria digitata]